jgi:sugar phosphate isomerase/epimerase
MTMQADPPDTQRRLFLGGTLCTGAAAVLTATGVTRIASASAVSPAPAAEAAFSRRVGLELWTVRDQLTDPRTRERTLERIAAIGFTEIEPDHGPSGGYLGLSPRQFRSLLERLGLSMPSTHLALADGPDVQQRLEGLAIMGLRYVVLAPPGSATIGIPGQMRMTGPALTTAQVQRDCAELNRYGRLASRFGMKVLVHNHTMEFAPLADDAHRNAYDLLLAETDPQGVAMQLDIGWAAVAGQDIIELFKKAPGRFELWHVKDASNIRLMPPNLSEEQRVKLAQLVPVGLGDVDYPSIFAQAGLAGMKHFCVEQDNAAAWGDSIAAARVSLEYLERLFAAPAGGRPAAAPA